MAYMRLRNQSRSLKHFRSKGELLNHAPPLYLPAILNLVYTRRDLLYIKDYLTRFLQFRVVFLHLVLQWHFILV